MIGTSILKMDQWKGDKLVVNYEDSSLKYLEEKASKFHNDVNTINDSIVIGKYVVHTKITGNKKNTCFKLSVKIKYYSETTNHEHKKNTHRQKINI